MIGFFRFIAQIAIVAALAIWLADRPGTAHIVWHDRIIETSATFLALIVVLLAIALHALWRLWSFLRHGPALWRLRRERDRLQRGHDQLTQGLVAIAGGHACEAGRLAVAARKNLGKTSSVQWLQAQAAQLAGDSHAAQSLFRALAASEDAAVLGYRGLIMAARRAGRWDEVERLAEALTTRHPATPWLSLIRLESAARRMNWQDANEALSHAAAARLIAPESGKRVRAALRIAASRAADAAGQETDALRLAEEAAREAPDWLPALIHLADHLAAGGHRRAALRLVERAWKLRPHPQLSRIVAAQAASPVAAYEQVARLAGENPAAEARLELGEAALAADIWGEARRHLTALAGSGEGGRRLWRALATLERRQHGDEEAARSWLIRGVETEILHGDPAWICTDCHIAGDRWQPVCTACGAFNTIHWQRPGERPASLPAAATAFDERMIHD